MGEQSSGGVWINPKDPFDKVLIVSKDSIAFANPPADQLAGAVEALSQGRADALARLGKVSGTPMRELNRVSSNLKALDVKFQWGSGKGAKSKSFTAINAEQRDHILRSVTERLGPGWVRKETQYGVARAALAPLVSMLVVAGLTALLYAAARDQQGASEVEIHGRHALVKRLFVWAVELLGPTGSLVAGGIVVALLVVWLVVRAKNPPLMAVIRPA